MSWEMDDSSEFSDMSWLTQVPKNDVPTFKIVESSDSENEELLVIGDSINHQQNFEGAIDLEDGKLVLSKQLYGDVFCKDISSDENIDGM